MCDETPQYATAIIKSQCFDKRPNDRYTVIYKYPSAEVGTVIANALTDSLLFSTGNESFLTEDIGTERTGILITSVSGDEFYLNTGVSPPELTFNSIPITLAESLGVYTGNYVSGIYTYDFTYDSNTDTFNIVITQTIGTFTIAVISANVITGDVTIY